MNKTGKREIEKIVADAIDLFIEYRDKHGCAEETAKQMAIVEFLDAEHYSEEQ